MGAEAPRGEGAGVGGTGRSLLGWSWIFPVSSDKTWAKLVSAKRQLLAHENPKAGCGQVLIIFFKDSIDLFICRERGTEKERERETLT